VRADFLKDSFVFTEETIRFLNEDMDYLEKAASAEGIKNFLKATLPSLVPILASTAVGGTIGYFAAKKQHEAHLSGLMKSYNQLGQTSEFKKNPINFGQRFSELMLISPTIASNPGLASKVITPRLSAGFDLDDVHRLSAIEYHTSRTPRPQLPGAAAKAQAMVGLDQAMRVVLPVLTERAMKSSETPSQIDLFGSGANKPIDIDHQDIRNRIESFHPTARAAALQARAEKWRAQGQPEDQILRATAASMEPLKKDWEATLSHYKSVDPRIQTAFEKTLSEMGLKKEGAASMTAKPQESVSEECLGRMLAETHMMCKEAGLLQTVGNFLKPSANKMVDYAKAMTIPLAIGVGVQAIRSLMQQRENAQMRQQADHVFSSLKRTSDVVRENPEIASEAFDSLRSFAPALAVKPIIARTFVENVVNSQGQLAPNTANMLASTQQIVQSIHKQTGGGFIAGLKEPMSLFSMHMSADHEGGHSKKSAKTDNEGLERFNKAMMSMSHKKGT